MTDLKSMTAYGRAEVAFSAGKLICEIQSLNKRHLELQINMPPPLVSSEYALRLHLTKHLGRGQVAVKIRIEGAQAQKVMKPEIEVINQIQETWNVLAAACEFDPKMPKEFLMAFKDQLFSVQPLLVEEAILLTVCDEALDALQTMKIEEGNQLGKVIISHIQAVCDNLDQIENRSPQVITNYRQKIISRLEEIKQNAGQDERILKEIALFAERADIGEELSRLKSHIKQLREWVEEPIQELNQAKGKKGEFITQELMRETNTLGAKANDAQITHLAIEMKVLLEKVRELMQNIE